MDAIDFIEAKQKEWFIKISPFLLKKNLNVGSGLGFFSNEAKKAGIGMISLEVLIHPKTINKEQVIIYNGKEMPFSEREFDVAVAMYVLHHSVDPVLVLNEMKRVASKRIILVEELYTSFFGKIWLVILDVFVNFKALQKSNIHWRSYFDVNRFKSAVENNGWKIVSYVSSPQKGFNEILCVAERS